MQKSNFDTVIFLDFDGVIKTVESYGKQHATFSCVKLLNTLIEQTKAKIVVSSSWRIGAELEGLKKLLTMWGVVGDVVGMTPRLYKQEGLIQVVGPRGNEIQAWLDENPGVKYFVILDDDSDMEHLKPYHVKTSFRHGLDEVHIKHALELFSRQKQKVRFVRRCKNLNESK